MNKIYLVTSNPGKIEAAKNTLQELDLGLDIEILKGEYPEDKSDETTERVALSGAKYSAEKYEKPVLVTDAGIYITALKGFPGVNTKFALERIGNEGLLKLLEDKKDRGVEWILSLGYCEPQGEPVEFTASIKGTIAKNIRGDKGFGFDPIFIAEGYDVTFGENPGVRDAVSPFRITILEFAEWYKSDKSPDRRFSDRI